MPSFNAIDLGPYCFVQVEAEPHEIQVNTYPGVDNLEVLRLGARGGTTHVQGTCVGSDEAALAAVEQTFRAMLATGVSGVLVDSLGTSWPGVILRAFRPTGPIGPMPDGIGRDFEAEFLHTQ